MSRLVRVLSTPLRQLRGGYRELTGQWRGFPSALIIGAQKGGTTSLFNYLVQHPAVLAPFAKEVHFFDHNYHRGLRWYRGRFPYQHRLRGSGLTLDASPYYLFHPLVPERAARHLPDVKLIALLRDPVDRALSHYQHEARGGREGLTFAEALDREADRLAGEEERLRSQPGYYSYNHHRYAYTRRGLYLEQLERWMRQYPRTQLLVLQSEQLFREPSQVMTKIHEFLGLLPHRLRRYKTFLQGDYDRAMTPALRARLAEYFRPHNLELYRWLDEEFDWQ